MMEILFNHANMTHSITRLRIVDEKPHEISVVEALINGRDYVFFESPNTASPQDLIGLAIDAWIQEGYDDNIEFRFTGGGY